MTQHIARIDELETRLAFQEELLEQLNQALSQQQIQLQDMHTAMQILSQRIKEAQTPPEQSKPADERPPHY